MARVDAAFEEKVFNVAPRERESHAEQHSQADHPGEVWK
jgi:hypothetical protein